MIEIGIEQIYNKIIGIIDSFDEGLISPNGLLYCLSELASEIKNTYNL